MPSKATIKFGSKEYDVVSYNFSAKRDVDAKGRPSSGSSGGLINITIETTEDKTVWQSFVSKNKPVDGTITVFKDDEEDAKLFETKWEKGFVVGFKHEANFLKAENVQHELSSNHLTHFTVSAEKLYLDDDVHDNNWPKA